MKLIMIEKGSSSSILLLGHSKTINQQILCFWSLTNRNIYLLRFITLFSSFHSLVRTSNLILNMNFRTLSVSKNEGIVTAAKEKMG